MILGEFTNTHNENGDDDTIFTEDIISCEKKKLFTVEYVVMMLSLEMWTIKVY